MVALVLHEPRGLVAVPVEDGPRRWSSSRPSGASRNTEKGWALSFSTLSVVSPRLDVEGRRT
ncbi:hypothetical protein [Streptomyces sp. NPDC004291]